MRAKAWLPGSRSGARHAFRRAHGDTLEVRRAGVFFAAPAIIGSAGLFGLEPVDLVPAAGIEPATYRLQGGRYAAESFGSWHSVPATVPNPASTVR